MKIKKICCIGAGYVGGPTMAVIAYKCPEIKITVVDIDNNKINAWNGPLNNLPIYEPGLEKIIKKVRGKNLFFSNDIDTAIIEAEMIFLAVNTPTKTEGDGKGMAADLRYVESSAKHIARVSQNDKIVIEKSTLPVKTAEKIKEILEQENSKVKFEILSNPEFLAEGTAIQDLFKSDRVLIGGDSTRSGQRAIESLVEIYSKWIPKNKILKTNIWSSELAKLASNAMLAQRISSINSLSAICEKTGADTNELSKAIGMDQRIGNKFLQASPGFGGSCFQKDILNLVYLCRHYGLDEVADYWHSVVKINDYQRLRFSRSIIENFGEKFQNNKVTLLGWAFKEATNDTRETSAKFIAKNLLNNGLSIRVFDPLVDEKQIFSDIKELMDNDSFLKDFHISKDIKSAINNANSIVLINNSKEFIDIDWIDLIQKTDSKIKIYDGRNMLKEKLKSYKYYYSL